MSFNSTIRLNSNQADPLSEEQKKALHRQQIELEKDWDAKILTYEEFLPKVNNPSPVSPTLFLAVPKLTRDRMPTLSTFVSRMRLSKE